MKANAAARNAPDLIVAVVDATNLRMNLRLVLELKRLGKPLLVAVNMADVARAQGLNVDLGRLALELAEALCRAAQNDTPFDLALALEHADVCRQRLCHLRC